MHKMRCKNFTANLSSKSRALININPNVVVTIYSDNVSKGLRKNSFIDFQKEYSNLQIKFYKSGGVFHDRYIILDYETEDEKIYLCGASSKDAGKRVTTILEDVDREKYYPMIQKLLNAPELKLK